jgi:predicted outer membrane repeat protein
LRLVTVRRSVLLALAFAVVGLPGVVADGAEAPGTETALTVSTEAEYRAALTALSADASGPHTISLAADVLVDDGGDPTYTGTEDLTVDGHGFVLDGAWTSRLLVVDSPTDAAVAVHDVTLTRGSTAATGGGGGAVLVAGDSPLTITDSVLRNNGADTGGGAVQVATTATIERTDFVRNETAGDGGAIDARAPEGRITVRASTFSSNRAGGRGGAVSAIGFPSPPEDGGIQGSTFAGNEADEGGAVVLGRGAIVANSTFAGNRALSSGGAILAEGAGLRAVVYTTVAENIAPEGANLTSRSPDLRVFFSVFAEPELGPNCAVAPGAAPLTESRADDASCPGAVEVPDVGLGLLADHGGRTETRVPVVGSPLIDAVDADFGHPAVAGGCAGFQGLDPVDQRGVVRPQDGDGRSRLETQGPVPVQVAADCDIGAVEAMAIAPVPPGPVGPVAAGPGFTG